MSWGISWRHDVFLTLRQTCWRHSEPIDVMAHFLTQWRTFWRHSVFLTLRRTYWHHDLFLMSWTFWRYDVFVVIMTYSWLVDVMMKVLTSWHIFGRIPTSYWTFWRHDELFDVTMNFLTLCRIFDVMTNILTHCYFMMNLLTSWHNVLLCLHSVFILPMLYN